MLNLILSHKGRACIFVCRFEKVFGLVVWGLRINNKALTAGATRVFLFVAAPHYSISIPAFSGGVGIVVELCAMDFGKRTCRDAILS